MRKKAQEIILTIDELNLLLGKSKENSIALGEIIILSTTETLSDVEKTANRLMEKHKDFLTLKRENSLKSKGYLG